MILTNVGMALEARGSLLHSQAEMPRSAHFLTKFVLVMNKIMQINFSSFITPAGPYHTDFFHNCLFGYLSAKRTNGPALQ